MTEIYYVEDDKVIAETVQTYLGQQNCSVKVFGTIADAKSALERHVPTLLLMDWNMPDGRGNTLCRWVRANWKELPIIYQLLLFLMQNKGRTLTREKLLEQVWDANGSYVNDNTLTVTMKRLREKLHQPPCIRTVRSVGYRMEDTV